MAQPNKNDPVNLQELMVSTLAMVDAVTKILIEKGVMSEAEFKKKLLEERAVYEASQSYGAVMEREPRKRRVTRSEAKQLRTVLSVRRGEHGEEARHALHEFIVRWAASRGGKKTKRPQG